MRPKHQWWGIIGSYAPPPSTKLPDPGPLTGRLTPPSTATCHRSSPHLASYWLHAHAHPHIPTHHPLLLPVVLSALYLLCSGNFHSLLSSDLGFWGARKLPFSLSFSHFFSFCAALLGDGDASVGQTGEWRYRPWLKMLDWDEQEDGVMNTIWSKLDEEDHVVTYPKDGEDGYISANEGSHRKQMVEQNSIDVKVTEQARSESKYVFHIPTMEPCSNPPTRFNKDSAPKFDNKCRSGGCYEYSNSPAANQFSGAPGMLQQGPNSSTELCHSDHELEEREPSSIKDPCIISIDDTMKVDGNSGLSFYGDNHGDNFLDYDWASITNFDDLDGMFSSDSAYGCETIDELLSPRDSFNTTKSPFPNLGGDASEGHRNESEMAVDSTISRDQASLLQFRTNLEEQDNSECQHSTRKWPQYHNQRQQSEIQVSISQPFQSVIVHQQEYHGGSEYLTCIPLNHHEFMEHGCSAPSQSPLHAARKQPPLLPAGYKEYSDHPRQSHSMQKPDGISSIISTMTPQEKIKKSRQNKQMKMKHPFKKQHKKFGQLVTKSDMAFYHQPLETNQIQGSAVNKISTEESLETGISELEDPLEPGDSRNISIMSGRTSLAEMVYCELQKIIAQLDDNLRRDIRDSLLRLARSAMERSNASDRSCNSIPSIDEDEMSVNVEESRENRLSRMEGAETETNPKDRIMAHLLFGNPHQSFAEIINEEPPWFAFY